MFKYLVIAIALIAYSLPTNAANEVNFEVDRSNIDSSIPTQSIERNVSKLLTAINSAANANASSVDFTGIDISRAAALSIQLMWENVKMRTIDDDIVQTCLKLGSSTNPRGYEIQNIGVDMLPVNPNEYAEPTTQEITITTDRNGAISDVVISMGLHQYTTLMKGAKTLEDVDQRMQILHFVEQFRTAYCQKDETFLENIFSDDALIITGRVIKRQSVEAGIGAVIDYTKQSKREYLNKLFKMFRTANSYINVKFDNIEIERNPVNPNIYGVTLRQQWHSSNYSDVGTVFLLWDFTNAVNPKIYVRTWQPNEDTHRFRTTEFDL